jgi:aspartate-semialdehyde dehydrogenase
MTKKYNVAVVGATGSIGREIINTLATREFPVENLIAVAPSKFLGKEISFGEDLVTQTTAIENVDFKNIDIVFNAPDNEISQKFTKDAISKGAYVIDTSSHFGAKEDLPLAIPEVNMDFISDFMRSKIIYTPNPITIALVSTLKPLDNEIKISRVVVSTYQSTSEAGLDGMDELYDNTKSRYVHTKSQNKVFEKDIAFNILPKIGEVEQDGYTNEEIKIIQETQKMMKRPVDMSVTSVRVPVFISSAMSVDIEFQKNIGRQDVYEILSDADGVFVDKKYVTPLDSVGNDEIFVSRIREDRYRKNFISMWIVADNLKKGSALNSVQIAEHLINYLK